MNILLPLLFVLFGCENDVKPLWLSGTWKGTFKDTHTSTYPKIHFVDQPAYPAELFYKVSTNSGSVSYPTLGCTSNWIFLNTDNDTLFFEEKVVSDKNELGCVDKMQYKLFQLSKNEIVIFGNRKTSNGSLIKTNGVLAKVDYKKNALAKSDASEQVKEPYHNVLNKPSNDIFNKVGINTEKIISNAEFATKANNELVGIWEDAKSYTDNYGYKTTKISVWEFKSDGKWIFDVWNNYMTKPIHGAKYYSYSNNTIFEKDNSKTKIGQYKILWEDDYNSFTVDSDNSLDGSYFVRVNQNQLAGMGGGGGGGSSDKQCGYCEGRGTVRCCDLGGFYKPDCLKQSVYINCMTSPTPCELRVTCCRCKGTGRY